MSRPTDPASPPERDDIGCLAAIEVFYAYLDGELEDPQTIAEFERHLEHCRSCLTRAELERILNDRLRKLGEHHAPGRLRSRLRRLIDKF